MRLNEVAVCLAAGAAIFFRKGAYCLQWRLTLPGLGQAGLSDGVGVMVRM